MATTFEEGKRIGRVIVVVYEDKPVRVSIEGDLKGDHMQRLIPIALRKAYRMWKIERIKKDEAKQKEELKKKEAKHVPIK